MTNRRDESGSGSLLNLRPLVYFIYNGIALRRSAIDKTQGILNSKIDEYTEHIYKKIITTAKRNENVPNHIIIGLHEVSERFNFRKDVDIFISFTSNLSCQLFQLLLRYCCFCNKQPIPIQQTIGYEINPYY